MSIRFTGSFDWDGADRRVYRATRRSLHGILKRTLERSNRLVPVDTSALRSSGYFEIKPRSLEGEIGYGTDYAMKQHEDMSLQHPNGGQAKFLEIALHQVRGDRLANFIKNEVEKDGGDV